MTYREHTRYNARLRGEYTRDTNPFLRDEVLGNEDDYWLSEVPAERKIRFII